MCAADRAVLPTSGRALDLAAEFPTRSFGPLSRAVTAAGYTGDIEVEIFNQAIWDADPADVVARTVRAFAESVTL